MINNSGAFNVTQSISNNGVNTHDSNVLFSNDNSAFNVTPSDYLINDYSVCDENVTLESLDICDIMISSPEVCELENALCTVSNINYQPCNQPSPVTTLPVGPYEQLYKFSKSQSKKLIFSHLNINSLSSKFMEIYEILQKGFTDIFFISETKLDDSYPNAQFNVPSFVIHRHDRNSNGGGLLCYMRETIPHKYRHDIAINTDGIESIVIQVKANDVNILFLHIYKPPNISANILNSVLEIMLNKCLQETKFVVVIGDLNVNFLLNSNQLTDICDTYDLRQTVKGPTCFKSVENPSLLDVLLTNCPKSLTKPINLSLGISDFHNYVSAATRINCPSNEPKIIYYRSFKNFDNDTYLEDLREEPFCVSQIFDDVDAKYGIIIHS